MLASVLWTAAVLDGERHRVLLPFSLPESEPVKVGKKLESFASCMDIGGI